MRRLMFILLVACGGASTLPKPMPTAATGGDPSCPVEIAGTSVTVEDTDSGAAFVFVTTGDVAELRKRAAVMAQKHNDHHAAMGPLPDGKDAGGGHDHAHHGDGGDDHSKHMNHANHGSGGMIGVHSKAAASDVEGGVKVAFISGAAEIGKLQTELRMHAKHYAAGTCEMK
jgi:hypothetical protein